MKFVEQMELMKLKEWNCLVLLLRARKAISWMELNLFNEMKLMRLAAHNTLLNSQNKLNEIYWMKFVGEWSNKPAGRPTAAPATNSSTINQSINSNQRNNISLFDWFIELMKLIEFFASAPRFSFN